MRYLREPLIMPIPAVTERCKMRFSFENRGKSSSVRICYVDYETYSQIYLITVYAKNEKDTLSKEECAAIKKLISMIEINLKNKKEAYHGCI